MRFSIRSLCSAKIKKLTMPQWRQCRLCACRQICAVQITATTTTTTFVNGNRCIMCVSHARKGSMCDVRSHGLDQFQSDLPICRLIDTQIRNIHSGLCVYLCLCILFFRNGKWLSIPRKEFLVAYLMSLKSFPSLLKWEYFSLNHTHILSSTTKTYALALRIKSDCIYFDSQTTFFFCHVYV